MKSQDIDMTALGVILDIFIYVIELVNQISGDFINCLEVGIWEEQLQSEDGQQQLLNVIKEVAIAKVVFTEISLAVLLKNVK